MTEPSPTPSPKAKLIAIIEKLTGKRFYGSLMVKFKNGRPVHCEECKTTNLDGENPRKEQGR